MSDRVPFVCGNWKMHKTISETVELIDGIVSGASSLAGVEIGIGPTFTALHAAKKMNDDKRARAV